MNVFQNKPIWGGLIISDFSTMPKQLEELNRVVDPKAYDEAATMIVGAAYSHPYGKMSYNSLKYAEATEDPSIFEGFAGMKGVMKSTMRLSTLKELAKEEGENSARGSR